METIPRINEGFANSRGEYFKDVREIAFKKGELIGNLGTFIKSSNDGISYWRDNLSTGVYIYQTYHDPNIAYRIYKCFADYGYDGEQDEKLIQCLAERKNKIKLSKFPLGVVTLDGKVIGQEIPYFQNTITLDEYFETNNNVDLIRTYKAIFEILKELYDNGIYYLDIHPKNFVIDKQLNIEIIDFMYNYMNFDFLSDANKNLYFSKLREMIDYFNQTQGIDLKVGKFKSVDNFDDAYIQVDEIEKKLKK